MAHQRVYRHAHTTLIPVLLRICSLRWRKPVQCTNNQPKPVVTDYGYMVCVSIDCFSGVTCAVLNSSQNQRMTMYDQPLFEIDNVLKRETKLILRHPTIFPFIVHITRSSLHNGSYGTHVHKPEWCTMQRSTTLYNMRSTWL